MSATSAYYLQEAPSLSICVQWMLEMFSTLPHLGTWSPSTRKYSFTTYGDTHAEVRSLCIGAARVLGLKRHDAVGILCSNRSEWLMVDFASAVMDMLVVGLHKDWSVERGVQIATQNGIKAVFTDEPEVACAINAALPENSRFQVVVIGGQKGGNEQGCFRYADLIAEGVAGARAGDDPFRLDGAHGTTHRLTPDAADELFTVMYSSGTGGEAKGVATPKATWRTTNCNPGPMSSIAALAERRAVSYMSLCHGADRGVCWFTSMAGGTVSFVTASEGSDAFYEQLQAVRPTFFLAMACSWQDLYARYRARLRDRLADIFSETYGLDWRALRCTVEAAAASAASAPAADVAAQMQSVEREFLGTKTGCAAVEDVSSHFRALLGDCLMIGVTGGGPTPPDVFEFVSRCLSDGNECRAVDSYGSTEFPGISNNGEVSPEVEMKLVPLPQSPAPNTGEILVRRKDGKKTVYLGNAELTRQSWEGGWYRTGDIGRMEHLTVANGTTKRRLQIVDRVKSLEEIYYEGDSVWIEPNRLEAVFTDARVCGLSHVVVLCDRNRDGVSLVVEATGDASTDDAALLRTLQGVATRNGLRPYEVPIGIAVERAERWTTQNGLITISGKVNRRKVKERYFSAVSMGCAVVTPDGAQENGGGGGAEGVLACLAGDLPAVLSQLAESLRFSAAHALHSQAQLHAHRLTGEALPATKKGSRKVFLETTDANGKTHTVETSSGKDWLVGCEALVFDKVSDLPLEGAAAAEDKSSAMDPSQLKPNSELALEVTGASRACGAVSVPFNCFEDFRVTAQRVAQRLATPLSLLRFCDGVRKTLRRPDDAEAALPPRCFAYSLAVETLTPCADGAPAAAAAAAAGSPRHLLRDEAAALNGQFDVVRRSALSIRRLHAGWEAEKLSRVRARQQEVAAILECLRRDAAEGVAAVVAKKPGASVQQVALRLLGGRQALLRKRIECEAVRLCAEGEAAWEELDAQLVRLRLAGDAADVDTRALPVTWRLNLDWILDPERRETTQCMFGCGLTVWTDHLQEHSNGYNGPCNTAVGVADEDHSVALGGDQSVTCQVTGLLMDAEVNEHSSPTHLPFRETERYHSLDSSADRLVDFHHLLCKLHDAKSDGDDAVLSLVSRNHEEAWVRDKQHIFWMHKFVCSGKDVGRFDTPASLISRACDAFEHRLCLGVPVRTLNRPRLTHPFSLPRVIGVEGIERNRFLWLTYRDLWTLVRRVAQALKKALPPQSVVMLAGYNDIEWVVADFACAVAGMTTVGVHTTLGVAGAAHIASKSGAVAMLAMADLFCHDEPYDTQQSWRVKDLVKEAAALETVVCMDMSSDDNGCSTVAETASDRVTVAFMHDWVTSDCDDVALGDMFAAEGTEWRGARITTFLPTSGSTGLPKLVAVSGRSFVSDISGDMEERQATSKSHTVSYIPLSHSSDRYKLWQHVAMGGRVALCFYAAHHWTAHESSKKAQMLNYASPVVSLFEQVAEVAPTSMACPPNIWAGLHDSFLAFSNLPSRLAEPLETEVSADETDEEESIPEEAGPCFSGAERQRALTEFARHVFGPRMKTLATGGSPTPEYGLVCNLTRRHSHTTPTPTPTPHTHTHTGIFWHSRKS